MRAFGSISLYKPKQKIKINHRQSRPAKKPMSTISHCVGEGKDRRTRLAQVEQAKRTAGASRILAFIAAANGPIRIQSRFLL
ncbi:putative beta-glucosidase [Trichinella spiralis]|uniref:Beta-glucosidase n=1 Tax=Trichinella spiralis TaxID=6334 RepID=A0ABR3KJ68_TRISP